MNVNTIYTSKLITVFTQPIRQHQIDTIEEILENEIPIGMSRPNSITIFLPLHNKNIHGNIKNKLLKNVNQIIYGT